MKSVRNLALLLVALLVLPLAAQTPTDPVAWLKAEGNAADATSYGNHGIVSGTVPYVTGKVGNAFNFTGNVANYVRIPNSASLQSSLLSVEYWVNFNSATNAVNVAKRNGSSDAWQAGIVYSGGNFLLQFVGNTSGGLFDWYSAPLSSPVGVWTHVALTYDGSTVKGYINGAQVLTQAVTLQLSSRTADIYVGNYAGTALPLDAKLDELSIYNRALSAAEVLAIFQAGSTGKTSPPTVTGISPSSGTTAGGTSVTVTGTNFTGATAVTFGGNAATNVTVVNATTITATTPPRTAGSASVVVATPGGSNAANSLYTYVAPTPTVTGVSPSSGSTLGGTSVTITGTNFTGTPSVTFGGVAATGVALVNSTTITATTPPGTAGSVSVIVTTGGVSNSANSLYTYVTPAPTVTGASPSSGSTLGGTSVTITGTSFTGATAVSFGGHAATGVTVVNSTTITATTPVGTAGTASVDVTTASGSSLPNSLYTYGEPPQVVGISPNEGSTEGGTSVTITGTNFTGTPSVTFGGAEAASFTVVDDTTITAYTPPGVAGPASVVVTNPFGSNAVSLFTYVDPNVAPSFALPDSLATWTPRDSSRNWSSITSSADGSKLAAVVNGGQIYTSVDRGVSWTPRESNRSWFSITSSADGSKLVAAVNGGQIYTSTDSGVSWMPRESNRQWYCITSSADGSKLAAAVNGGQIYTSADSGVSWTPRENNRSWFSITSSADGSKLAAVDFYTRQIYTSTDSGVSWTPRGSSLKWWSITSSADGSKLAAVEIGGQIYTSTDSGVSWTPRESDRLWTSITSSADGRKLAAVVYSGQIYTSTDSGVSWTPRESNRFWGSITSSADGNTLAALGSDGTDGQIYTNPPNQLVATCSSPSTTVNFATNISPGSATEAGQTVSFQVSNDNNALFTTQPAISSNGTLTFTPGSSTGVATVTVSAVDNGGTAYDGVDTSPPQTFVISVVPAVTSVSPPGGTTVGGTSVTITGIGFTGATHVTFNSLEATSFTVVNDTTITAITPAGVAGTASVEVTTASGSSLPNSLYTYVTPTPTVTEVSPSSGSTLGGTNVTISGNYFTGASAVTFGGAAAASFTVVDDTTITATTPPGVAGVGSVAVTNPFGSNAAALFTYVAPNVAPSFSLPDSWTAWTPYESNRTWKTLASSADGTRLAAVVQGGQIFTSADSGVTWTARENNRNWGSIASSADGTRLAAVELGGRIYTSTDSGVTWTARASNASWSSIASSADGLKLAAVAVFGQISISTDGGVTWTARENSRIWNGITSSADGMKLAAEVSGGQIYTSTDGGATWTAQESVRNWGGITSSSDGSKLAAIVQNGQIHTSSDGGVTWTPQDSSRNWWSITSSADGGKLAAVVKNGQIYTSIDSGVTWTARESTRTWQTITTSADGSKLVAAVAGGQIHTSSRLPYNVTVLANSGPSTTGSFASSISPGPVAETSQTVTFQVTNNNNALFTVQPAISSNGTLTFTPGSSGGTATITVLAIDDGGIAYGGVNTSTPQTFTITVLAPIETWRQAQFGNATAGIGDNDDFDGDGLVNLLEYGLVLSPIGQSASPAAEFVSYAEGDRLRLILQRDPARSDVTIEVQAAGDLTGTWTTLATSTNGAPFTGPGYVGGDSATPGVKTVEIRDIVNTADASSRFLRVKVSR